MPKDVAGLSVVTGAFGYTGRHIAHRLLALGDRVKTLTGHPDRPNPFNGQVSIAPMDFGDAAGLARSLEGATTLYNTYWVRFPRGETTFDMAVDNTATLVKAAEDAGVRKIVHVSIIGASSSSPLPYFRGKGLAEEAVRRSGLSYAVIRPTVVFGSDDILINNIAWAVRRFPFFPIFGDGGYKVQPVHVGDVAEMAVSAGRESGNQVMDAAGPETNTFEELVRLIAGSVGSRSRLVRMPRPLALAFTTLGGYLVRDVVLTRDEADGLMAGLLVSQGPPTGKTSLRDWLAENGDLLGRRYASELGRHYR